MRKVLISLATAASALALASPAAAQWYPPQPPPQGYGYGYHDPYRDVRNLQVRLDRLQRHIHQLDRRNVLSNREAAQLWQQSRAIEQRLHVAARNGLHPREADHIEARIIRLEQRIWRDARDGRNWGRHGYNDGQWDRDHSRWHDRNDRRRHRDRDDDDDDD